MTIVAWASFVGRRHYRISDRLRHLRIGVVRVLVVALGELVWEVEYELEVG
ncbi:MAG: hypothetical protein OSB75_09885 [Dehalococcoidia bacterium]|nr:hypothetical protein [Dehalococcoidia bacterium]